MRLFIARILIVAPFVVLGAMCVVALLFLLALNFDLKLPQWTLGFGFICMFVISVLGVCRGVYQLIQMHRSATRSTRTSKRSNVD